MYQTNQSHKHQLQNNWIDAYYTFDTEFYHPELYDVFIDKMLHQFYHSNNPYEEGHSKYIQCPVCQHFIEQVKREYTAVDFKSTQFTIEVSFPENTILQIQVEEKRSKKHSAVQVHFQVGIIMSISGYTIQLNNRPVQMEDFLKSWMNSLFLKLNEQSKKSQQKIEMENNQMFEIII